MLEECEHQLQAQQQRCEAAKERLDWLVKTISTIRAGVEHLANKLQHITVVNTTFLTFVLNPFFLKFWSSTQQAFSHFSPE